MSMFNQLTPFRGSSDADLRQWAVETRLPELVELLGLTAGAICPCLPETLRRKAYGLGEDDALPPVIDWNRNGIIISPPGTGKGVAIFPAALAHFQRVRVLVPSVIQAHKLEASLDTLFHRSIGGCVTSQRQSPGLIEIWTTGVFHQRVLDSNSELWKDGTVLFVDEAQRVLEEDPVTEFFLGYMASFGLPVFPVSATIAPGRLPQVFGHGPNDAALVYELTQQMHPIDIAVKSGDKPDILLSQLECLRQPRTTTLVFASARREVMRVTHLLRKWSERDDVDIDVFAIPVTGAHEVESQLRQIELAQKTNKPVVVVATPGTMDSSVTITGLSTVVILDNRWRVDWNEHGVIERWSERLPINHIWQMVRRVGRLARTDGKRDQVFIISSGNRPDVLAAKPKFEPLTGCSPYTPIESLLLEAVRLNVKFRDVHGYMLSTFSEDHMRVSTDRLIERGMIEQAADASDPDGFVLTEKGSKVVALPYDYRWRRLIVEAPHELQLWLCMAAAGGELQDLESFEADFSVRTNERSEVLRRIDLGVEYVQLKCDEVQRDHSHDHGLSFRRLEQVETLFQIGAKAIGLDWSPRTLRLPDADEAYRLLEELVLGGMRVGLFDLYLVAEGRREWSEAKRCPGTEGFRRFFTGRHDKVALKQYAEGGVCVVVADAVWFEGRGGPSANLKDLTIVPPILVQHLIAERAARDGWMQLTFQVGEYRGKPELSAELGGMKYIPARADNDPEPGRAYWCELDYELAWNVSTVWVHYPVV